MRQALERRLRNARVRHGANLLLGCLGAALFCAGAAAALAVTADRLFSLELLRPALAGVLAGAAVAAAGAWWAWRLPRRMEVALLVDERLALKERFSTAVALSASDDLFARAAVREAHQKAESVRIAGQFPVRPTRRWLAATAAWVLAAGLFVLMPPLDILGRAAEQRRQQTHLAQLEQARSEVQQVTGRVEATVRELGKAELAADLAKLAEMNEAIKAPEVRREAIRKLGDLADKLRELQAGPRQQTAEAVRDMLKGLRGTPQGFSRELDQALARGDLGKASDLLKDMQKKLEGSELSKEQKEALANQLANLSEQLGKLSQDRKGLEDSLRQAGSSADLARLDEQALREALKKQGLTDEQIEKLLQQAQACRQGGAACSKLAEAMGAVGKGLAEGKLSPAELAELTDQLDSIEAMLQDAALTGASLEEIGKAIALLGAGQCEGQDQQGLILNVPNAKGRGRAWGSRGTDPTGPAATTQTRAGGKTREGPVIASWYFKGPQVKGESRKQLSEVVQAAKDGAAEAVSENEIPRKYEEAVKKYFGDLEQSVEDRP